jgi:hypothetical protein
MELVNGLLISRCGCFLGANPVILLYKAYSTENSEEPSNFLFVLAFQDFPSDCYWK